MSRQRRRARLILVLALCAAVAAAAAGFVLSGNRARPSAAPRPGSTAAPSAPQPGSTQARADLTKMQALLNTGSASQQAALLVPGVKFVSSGPIFPAGTTVTIRQGTFRSHGQFGTVQAVLSDKTVVTLGLYSAHGHWYLYDVQAGAQTSAKVTAGPDAIDARLMSDVAPANDVPKDVPPPNHVPTWQEIGTRTPVILVHGFGESAANWSDGGDMLTHVDSINGVMTLRFDYKPTDHRWVDDPANGPALTKYIHAVAQASRNGHGPGKVVLVTFSMGGLLTRYAATTGGEAGDISMVITIGTPNEGSFLANAHDMLCYKASMVAEAAQPGFCSEWTAASAMSVFGPQIRALGQLPPGIALHAIAGDEFYVWKIWGAKVGLPLFGDGVVTTGSALHKRPGWQHDTFDTFRNPLNPGDVSVWHLALKGNPRVIQLTHDYIYAWVQAHQPAPVLGGDAYWLADGGKWYVHGMGLQLEPGPEGPPGYVGEETWNAYGAVVIGHASLAFTSNADGSLTGTYTSSATYTYAQGNASDYPEFQPDPLAPRQGQTVTLVPIAPHHAKSVYNGNSPSAFVGGNTNLCQTGLANPSQYCGA